MPYNNWIHLWFVCAAICASTEWLIHVSTHFFLHLFWHFTRYCRRLGYCAALTFCNLWVRKHPFEQVIKSEQIRRIRNGWHLCILYGIAIWTIKPNHFVDIIKNRNNHTTFNILSDILISEPGCSGRRLWHRHLVHVCSQEWSEEGRRCWPVWHHLPGHGHSQV